MQLVNGFEKFRTFLAEYGPTFLKNLSNSLTISFISNISMLSIANSLDKHDSVII